MRKREEGKKKKDGGFTSKEEGYGNEVTKGGNSTKENQLMRKRESGNMKERDK